MRHEALALSAALAFSPQSAEACASAEEFFAQFLRVMEARKIINAVQARIEQCVGETRQQCIEGIIVETERALERNPLTRDCRIFGVHPLQVQCAIKNTQRARKAPRKR